jgi:hypothetical protein
LLAVSLSATAAGGCGTTTVAKEGSGSTDTAAALDEGGASFRSNQRRLTRAQSLKLVAWATSFRQCMVADGGKLGPLVTDASEIAMKLPAAVRIESLLRRMEMCGERQAGPPRRASLQYRPGKIVLYLPKQCLLDKKVAGS